MTPACRMDDNRVVRRGIEGGRGAIDLRGLSVADRAGVVRVSTDPKAVGKPSPERRGAALPTPDIDVAVIRQEHESGSAFWFEAPIRFQGKQVSKIHLGLPEEPDSRHRQARHRPGGLGARADRDVPDHGRDRAGHAP